MIETGLGSARVAGYGINFVELSGYSVMHGLRIVVCRPVWSILELHTVCPWHLGTKASVSESLMCYRLACRIWKRARFLVLEQCNS
jgi:hypothetical protein